MDLSSKASIGGTNKRKPINKAPPPKKSTSSDVIVLDSVKPLPSWHDDMRGMSADLLHCGLFGLVTRGARKYLRNHEIFSQKGLSVFYTGDRLDQNDLDVFLALLHLVRGKIVGDSIKFYVDRAYLLELCGKKNGGTNVELLKERIARLQTGLVVKNDESGEYNNQLLGPSKWLRDSNILEFTLYAEIIKFFPNGAYTGLNWKVRKSLHNQSLAQWIHAYYQSHVNPFPIRLVTLYRLCGSEATLLKTFKLDVKRAFAKVKEASQEHGESFEGEVISEKLGDKVYVTTHLTPSKERYAKKHGTPKVGKPQPADDSLADDPEGNQAF
jgi:hypothetical protein